MLVLGSVRVYMLVLAVRLHKCLCWQCDVHIYLSWDLCVCI